MSHSKDLRERAIKYVEQGGMIKDACKLFVVSRSSFQRWIHLKSNTVSLTRRPREKSPYKVDNESAKRS
jgi:transposase